MYQQIEYWKVLFLYVGSFTYKRAVNISELQAVIPDMALVDKNHNNLERGGKVSHSGSHQHRPVGTTSPLLSLGQA